MQSIPLDRRTDSDDDLPHKSINDAQLMLLFSENAEKYTDAKVICKGVEWKVHQLILCARCPFFEACFRSEKFKEGQTKSVDFCDDEPYAVEALLIYLYTLEYPDRKSHKFEQPEARAEESKSAVEKTHHLICRRGCVSKALSLHDHVPMIPSRSDEVATDSARFKLKSVAPQQLWQERLALYRMAHRLDLKELCCTTLGIMTREIDKALFRSSNVAHFIRELYDLGHDQARSLKREVAERFTEREPFVITQAQLDLVLLSHPLFGCDLIKAMKKKDKNRIATIAALRMASDRQKDEIAELQLIISRQEKRLPRIAKGRGSPR